MILPRCTEKIRDIKNNTKIAYYKLVDVLGREEVVKSKDLKFSMKWNYIDVINLKLTRDYRIIDKNIDEQDILEENNIKAFITKVKFLCYNIRTIEAGDHSDVIIASKLDEHLSKNDRHIIYIPNSTKYLNKSTEAVFTVGIYQLFGTIEVVNGNNIKHINSMFEQCRASVIDLTKFNPSDILNSDNMFLGWNGKLICDNKRILKQYEVDQKINRMKKSVLKRILDYEAFRVRSGEQPRSMIEIIEKYESTKHKQV